MLPETILPTAVVYFCQSKLCLMQSRSYNVDSSSWEQKVRCLTVLNLPLVQFYLYRFIAPCMFVLV
jgi:hypothetical protein